MIKKLLFGIVLLFLLGSTAIAALSYGEDYYLANRRQFGSGNPGNDPYYLFANEVVGLLEGSAAMDDALVTGTIGLLESTGATYYTYLQAGDQSASLTYTLPTAYGTTGQYLSATSGGVMSWGTPSSTFTGGAISSDITLADTVDILPTTIITDTFSIQVYDTDAPGYLDVMRWTNATTPTIVIGEATTSFALASTGVDISAAGAISNVTTLDTSGTATIGGDADVTGALTAGSWTVGAGAFSTTGATTLGDGTATVAVNSSVWDITTVGVMSGITTITGLSDLSLTGDITMATGKVIKGAAVSTNTLAIQVYDNDTGPGYKNAILLTNGNTPAIAIGDGNPTVAIDTADWDISTAGAMTGIAAITSDGLFTTTGGVTASGTVSINDTAGTATTSIGAGTTTGKVTIGGTGTQAIAIGDGVGIKTVTLGTDTTSSTTTIKGGSAGVNINTGTFDDPTNINTGLNTGTVTIGGTGAMTIAIGNGGTGAKVVALGDDVGASSLTLKAGTGDMSITSVDDLTLNGGSLGSIINVGTNTHGNAINIGTDNTAADAIVIGSALDTSSLLGISVTLGSTGTTSTTAISSGSGGVNVNASNNQPTNINTGTSTGTVTIGNALATFAIASTGLDVSTAGAISSVPTLTGSNGQIVNFAVNQRFEFADNSENFGFDVGTTADTVKLTTDSGIATLDFNDVDALTGLGSLAFDAVASTITLASDGAGQDLTISVTGATDSSLKLASAGTGADALKISTSDANGDIDIDSSDDLTIDVVGDLTFGVTGTVSMGGAAVTYQKMLLENVIANDVLTVAESGKVFVVDGNSVTIQLTLPSVGAADDGCYFVIYDANEVAASDVTILRADADTINGSANLFSSAGTDKIPCGITIFYDHSNTDWKVLIHELGDGTAAWDSL